MSSQKKVYLTIDDVPSADFEKKLHYLYSNDIPAILFCIGEKMETQTDLIIDAIKKGYLIANHSYSHPYFSKISFKEAKSEIYRTDQLINRLYREANTAQPYKLFRFPYGDKGWTKKIHPKFGTILPNKIEKKINTKLQRKHQEKIQRYLQELGYSHPEFGNITYPFYKNMDLDKAYDVYWTFDFLEFNAQHIDEVLSLIEQEKIQDTINGVRCKLVALWTKIPMKLH